ncbi:MAG: NADH-quinone oxidoreductase subunit B family protein [Acidimicrobiales bacterium]
MAWITKGIRNGILTTDYPRELPEWLQEAHDGIGEIMVARGWKPTGKFRRSLYIRHVDAGSDGSVEMEVAALLNPLYDINRLGIYFTASPRHADMLMVTGAGVAGMIEPLRTTYDAMPFPKVVMAVGSDTMTADPAGIGDDALRSGVDHELSGSAVASAVPVDIFVQGDPPSPITILHGILVAMGVMDADITLDTAGTARATGQGAATRVAGDEGVAGAMGAGR